MPIRITQIDEADTSAVVLKVEGSLRLADAELLEQVCQSSRTEAGRPITLKLADLDYLDSDSASVLCRMKCEQGVALEEMHLFTNLLMELTEAAAGKPHPPAEDEG